MQGIAVMTDSNSGMSREEGERLGISVLPMPFLIDGTFHLEGVDLTQEEFYRLLGQNAEVSTSQPSPGEIMDWWGELLNSHDEVLYIPMSSSLSESCHAAQNLALEYGGKVQVVDNRRISVTQRQSVLDAVELAKKGLRAPVIKEILEREALEASIYITVDTLKYLKKGGRITSAAAAIGTVLNLKPVLTIQGGKLDAAGKARGMKAARRIMVNAMGRDCESEIREGLPGREDAASDRIQPDLPGGAGQLARRSAGSISGRGDICRTAVAEHRLPYRAGRAGAGCSEGTGRVVRVLFLEGASWYTGKQIGY